MRNEDFMGYELLVNITQRAASPGDSKDIAGIKAIPYQYLFNINLLFRYLPSHGIKFIV